MSKPHVPADTEMPMLPALPGWILSSSAETPENAAFQSGAALAHLALLMRDAALPQPLWRDRLALAAAEACAGHAGRRDGAGALRDALHLTKAGDDPGPSGRILRQWSRAVARPISEAALAATLEGLSLERVALLLDTPGSTPVDRAAQVIEGLLADRPRAETAALVLADAVLASSLGWTHMLPLLGLKMKVRDLRLRGDDLRLICHRATVAGAALAVPLAVDLARRAARLRAVAPKLRAKAAGRAVDLFLSRDAVSPSALGLEMRGNMSDRAARRLCDRLVELSALRELTGRDSFRLYGV